MLKWARLTRLFNNCISCKTLDFDLENSTIQALKILALIDKLKKCVLWSKVQHLLLNIQ